ncbi:MAG: PDZ domain-containing protein [Pirellulaceae bacterium]
MPGYSRLCGYVALFSCLVLAASEVYAQQSNRVMAGVRFAGSSSVVNVLIKGGPADRAGIEVGDEILSVGEKFVVQPIDLIVALNDKTPGDQVRIEVKRGDEFLFFDLQLIRATQGDMEIGTDGQPVAEEEKLGILNEIVPELEVDRWYCLTTDHDDEVKLEDLRGKIVCMLLFQTECEYCRRYGVPQFKELHDVWCGDPDVAFLAIQTPFFDFDKNTPEKAMEWFEELGFEVPIGHDGSEANRSHTFGTFNAPGTPWMTIIDQKGVVRFNDSRIDMDEAQTLIEKLKAEADP